MSMSFEAKRITLYAARARIFAFVLITIFTVVTARLLLSPPYSSSSIMLFNSLLLLLTASTTTVFASSDDYAITGTMDKRRVSLSAGKLAKCVGGTINVSASATNIKLLIKSPADHYAATDIGVKMQQVGSNFTAHVTSGDANAVSGTFRIYSALCLPADAATASKVQTVQFLTHGATLDRNYWDIAHGYSYVDAAAQAGYATFSYDRLGTGLSDHPDPIQVVQTAIQVEIAHQLVNLLRTSTELGRSFRRVVGVGHSAGSVISQGVTTRYPNDFDALILTGTSTSLTSINAATASFDLAPAALDPSGRFEGLDYAYQTQAAVPQALQFAFFSHPFFEPKSTSR
jgi:hypothetical protein